MAKIKWSQEVIVFVSSAVLFIAFSIFLNGFFNPRNIMTLLKNVSVLGILGLGMAIVVIGRGIDLAMIATMVVSIAWAMVIAHSGVDLGSAFAIAALFSMLVGIFTGIIVAYAEIPAIFTTLAVGSIVYGIGRSFFFQLDVQNAPSGYGWFDFLGSGRLYSIPASLIVFMATAVALHLVIKFTRFGRFVYAIGENPYAAWVSGLPKRPLMITQYVIGSLVAFMAGVVMAAGVSGINTRLYNSTMIYDVLLVVVFGGIGLSGGKGGVRNVLVGTFFVGTLLNGMTIMNISYTTQNLIKSIALLGAIILDTLINPRDEQTSQQGDI